jgi:hypothetical protein
MLTTILIIVLALIVAGGLLVFGCINYIKSQDRRKSKRAAVSTDSIDSSRAATCAGCGEKRIIVSRDDTLCAACYSALRTKKLG